ncbi:hypothetical protein CBM2598_U10104 [Cupriavidus taiwanensis]|uniref:Uncharacterized protein n=1 Tax=Cupriavidus taiwanensis TaxID=164546 RepID=A0A7Z7JIX0_9BURK|nr:hypothetical protein CBM2597_U10247 [Cupriavidus taiwanensis]SOZ96284.1 hypothetical protein CBM2598_U10104 [Cupriavidus taiwanensis]SPC25752.1 hypothetical protein CBM2594_U10253 [Cupriavidus taiwanensis]
MTNPPTQMIMRRVCKNLLRIITEHEQKNENKTSPDLFRGGGELRTTTGVGMGPTSALSAVARSHRQGRRWP